MDLARSASTRACRFFRDSGVEATIKWYRAPAGAKVFPVAHKWNHLTWYSRPWEATGVGEVYDAPDKWANGFTPPTAVGDHYFGTLQDFQEGAAFNPFNVTPRDTWGLAVGCGGIADQFVLLEQAYNPVMLTEDGGYVLLES
jgi:hypothetical protein